MNPKEDHTSIHSMSRKAYLEYQRLFPMAIREKMPAYTTLILTLAAVTIFGLFAINPTVGTILELRRELEDAKLVDTKLQTKIDNLRLLGNQYAAIEKDLVFLTDAIPQDSKVVMLLGQIQAVASDTNVTLLRMEVTQTPLLIPYPQGTTNDRVALSVDVQGNYDGVSAFIKKLIQIDRLILTDDISITRDSENPDILKVRSKISAYFAK